MIQIKTHLTDIGTRAQLEIQFAQQIDAVIHQLVYSNFEEEDINTFIETVKTFLKYLDLKQYILNSLYDKIKEASNIILPSDSIRFTAFRKTLRAIIRLGDNDLIDTLETFFLKDKKIKQFFVLLEEKKAIGMDTKGIERRFISALNTYYETDINITNQFLNILGKDKGYLIRALMDTKLAVHNALAKFIEAAAAENSEDLRNLIVPILTQEFDGEKRHYMSLIKFIIGVTPEFTNQLLVGKKWDVRKDFSECVLKNYMKDISLIKNYCQYLFDNDLKELEEFEKEYILTAKPIELISYAKFVPCSNKRKVLHRLVIFKSEDDRNEEHLVDFIHLFPEYGSLLPML